jgi:hypothetical protein
MAKNFIANKACLSPLFDGAKLTRGAKDHILGAFDQWPAPFWNFIALWNPDLFFTARYIRISHGIMPFSAHTTAYNCGDKPYNSQIQFQLWTELLLSLSLLSSAPQTNREAEGSSRHHGNVNCSFQPFMYCIAVCSQEWLF